MKTNSSRAFTRLELLAVVITVTLLATLFVRAQIDDLAATQARARRLSCVANLKQIGLAFRIWSNDHGDTFPMAVSATKRGSMESIAEGDLAGHFRAISNELASPKVLTCLADTRARATNFIALNKTNLSYFVALDADEAQPEKLLAGDRNVTNGVAPAKSLLDLAPDRDAGWTETMHVEAGNLGLSDGSAAQVTTAALRAQLRRSKDPRNRIQLPE